MLATVFCKNGSGNLTLNTNNGFFEITIYTQNKRIFKKYLFYKKAVASFNRLLKKYNLK
jgi:hypothetical protein